MNLWCSLLSGLEWSSNRLGSWGSQVSLLKAWCTANILVFAPLCSGYHHVTYTSHKIILVWTLMPHVSPPSPDLSLELPSSINLSVYRHTRQDKSLWRKLSSSITRFLAQCRNQTPHRSDKTWQQSNNIILHLHSHLNFVARNSCWTMLDSTPNSQHIQCDAWYVIVLKNSFCLQTLNAIVNVFHVNANGNNIVVKTTKDKKQRTTSMTLPIHDSRRHLSAQIKTLYLRI